MPPRRAKFTVARRLEERVQPMVVGPTVHLAKQVATQAKENAPPLKNWVSKRDALVRPQHVQADLDGPVPENLRFKLHSHPWDRQHRRAGEFAYITEPPRLLPNDSPAPALMANCRCRAVRDPDGIRKLIEVEAPMLSPNGMEVKVNVVCEGDHVVDSEFGTVYPGDVVALGSFFMRRAAVQVAFKRRSAQTFTDALKRSIG